MNQYTIVVSDNPSAVVGEQVNVTVKTLVNGAPLGNQTVTIAENGVLVATKKTSSIGDLSYVVSSSSPETDTLVLTWVDPSGASHIIPHRTTFSAPVAAVPVTPIPNDDMEVVSIKMISSSNLNDAVYFTITSMSGMEIQCQLDTGAFELMFTGAVANAIGLPNLRPITVSGVGGSAPSYESVASFKIGDVPFTNVPCVVEPSFSGYPLFGYRFFVDNGYDLLVSQRHQTITIMKPKQS